MDAFEAASRRLQRAETLRLLLRGSTCQTLLDEARALLRPLRDQRAWLPLVTLSEVLLRQQADDHAGRRLYAQGLIELGATGAALSLLQGMADSLNPADAEWAEAWGLIGRCHKQMFAESAAAQADAGQPLPAAALRALHDAAAAYAKPYQADPQRHVWHGVNLLALGCRALRLQGAPALALPGSEDGPKALANTLLQDLLAQQARDREDPWLLASLAEVALGRAAMAGPEVAAADLALAAYWVQVYLDHPAVGAFMVASTLRQFTEIWGLDTSLAPTSGVAASLLDLLRARLLRLPGGALALRSEQLQPDHEPPPGGQPRKPALQGDGELEALLSSANAKTLAWWHGGMQAARAVAVVRKRMGARLGTGFLLRAGALGLRQQPDELLLLTNFHVVNREGLHPAIAPEQAEVLFEAAEPGRVHTVAAVLWQSPVNEHDAALLRLAPPPQGIEPLLLATRLPPRPAPDSKEEDKPRVYIIGHPGGREIAISLTDNALIDHEAPPEGKPAQPGVWRLHYRAPTEGGNSGSPVFNDEDWGVIALHHKGGRFGMPRLNGGSGSYAANEGLALTAIAAALRQALEPS